MGAGTVSSAYDASRAAGQSCRHLCAVALAAFGQSRSWLFRATDATQSDILPRRDSVADLEVATLFGGEVTFLAEA